MSALHQFWQVLNFVGPALGAGVVAALFSKLLWRRQLGAVSWLRLTAWAVTAGAIALCAGLIATGRDGMMATYGAMVLSIAGAIWFVGFGPLRRRTG